MTSNVEVMRLVVFAILMEHDDGILTKSPKYIAEKYRNAMTVPYPIELLDWSNKRKFKRWYEAWIERLIPGGAE